MIDEAEASRSFEVVCGVVLAVPATASLAGVTLILINASWTWGVVVATFGLLMLGFWLSRLSYRLLLGRGRSDGGLFGPLAILFFGVLFASGAVGSIAFGVALMEWQLVLFGVAGLRFLVVPCWNLYRKRARPD